MKALFTFLLISISFLTAIHSRAASPSMNAPRSVQVNDQDAVLLFRYVAGAGVPLTEDTQNQILQTDLMMCSNFFSAGQGPKLARCLLPNEKVRIENENAYEVTMILKKYGMPSDHQLGYETIKAGLKCTRALSGEQYPLCFLIPSR